MNIISIFIYKVNALSIILKMNEKNGRQKLFATCCNDHIFNLFQYAVLGKCQKKENEYEEVNIFYRNFYNLGDIININHY